MPLYRTGAVSAATAVALYVVAFVVLAVSGQPPDSGGAATLDYVAAHRTVYIIRQVLWETPALFTMVAVPALAVALRRHGPSLAAVAGMIAVSSWAFSFAWPTTGDGPLATVLLSDRYSDATSATERPSLVIHEIPGIRGVLAFSMTSSGVVRWPGAASTVH